MKVYLVTHGKKGSGTNPGLTEEGRAAITKLILPDGIRLVIVGTGKRFLDTLQALNEQLGDVQVTYAPICGTADNCEKAGDNSYEMELANGSRVPTTSYLGLIGTPGINLRIFMIAQPEGTLLIVGREFLEGIGFPNGASGKLYMYDGEEVTEVA